MTTEEKLKALHKKMMVISDKELEGKLTPADASVALNIASALYGIAFSEVRRSLRTPDLAAYTI